MEGVLWDKWNTADTEESLSKELAACKQLGIAAALADETPAKSYKTALVIPGNGQFHPLKYLYTLAERLQEKGVHVFTNTHALTMKGGMSGIPGVGGVKTKEGSIVTCDQIVVATGTPVNDNVTFHTKQEAYRSYVIAARVPRDAFGGRKFLLWTSGENYKYVRLENDADRRDCDYLLVGGADSKVGEDLNTADERFKFLEEWTRKNFPMIQSVDYRWSGEVYEPLDFLPYAGRNPGTDKEEYVITGDSGTGMTNQTAGARLVADLILGNQNPWEEAFRPGRKPWKEAPEWVATQASVGANMLDYVKPSSLTDETPLKPGEGAVLHKNLKPVAFYRDESGTLHAYSAICTHLYCVVRWNEMEKSFDCPCHGSRFSKLGVCINGPANRNLKKLVATQYEACY